MEGWRPGLLIGTALAVAGIAYTVREMGTEALAMEGQHWIMLLIAVAVGYVTGRVWTQPAKLVGLP